MIMTSLHGSDIRVYDKDYCISFRKTNELYGGLSNMAPGFPITINQHILLTSEALYQCCRFPNHPDIQAEIIKQRSPMTAKDISRKNIHFTRDHWNRDRVKIMRWCVYSKLIFNWYSFGELLDSTNNNNIVEDSYKDDFWGARLNGDQYIGVNALGRLLMQARETYRRIKGKTIIVLPPPNIPNFCLLGKKIDHITVDVTNQPYSCKMW